MFNILFGVGTLIVVLFTVTTIPPIINMKSKYSEFKLLVIENLNLRHQEGYYDLQRISLDLDKLFKKILFVKISGFIVNCCICIGMILHKPILSLLSAVLALVNIRIFSIDYKLCDKLDNLMEEQYVVLKKIINSMKIR